MPERLDFRHQRRFRRAGVPCEPLIGSGCGTGRTGWRQTRSSPPPPPRPPRPAPRAGRSAASDRGSAGRPGPPTRSCPARCDVCSFSWSSSHRRRAAWRSPAAGGGLRRREGEELVGQGPRRLSIAANSAATARSPLSAGGLFQIAKGRPAKGGRRPSNPAAVGFSVVGSLARPRWAVSAAALASRPAETPAGAAPAATGCRRGPGRSSPQAAQQPGAESKRISWSAGSQDRLVHKLRNAGRDVRGQWPPYKLLVGRLQRSLARCPSPEAGEGSCRRERRGRRPWANGRPCSPGKGRSAYCETWTSDRPSLLLRDDDEAEVKYQ